MNDKYRKRTDMRYIQSLQEGETIRNIYLCKVKRIAETRNGKPYDNLILQDKTGSIDAKIWDPHSNGIEEYEEKDFVEILGDIKSYNGALQLNIRQLRKAHEGEYVPGEYMPVTEKNVDTMYEELLTFIGRVKDVYYRQVLEFFFVKNEAFIKTFKEHSAAKSVHHGFSGGLLEHTLSVARMCEYYLSVYPILNADLLYTAAIFHDIGKVRELSVFPDNDYTDEGQLIGHIIIGTEMINEAIVTIDGFPEKKAHELKHCILAHHGELEYGSPKRPSLPEALALNFADTTDAKLQTITELLKDKEAEEWSGYNRLFETNLRKSSTPKE